MTINTKGIFKTVFFLAFLVGSSSCGDQGNNTSKNQFQDEFEEYYEFQLVDLSDKEFKATMYLPDETANIGASTKPLIQHGKGELRWDISVGPKFHLVIEDQGNYTDLLEVHKKTLEQNSFFKIDYLVEDSVVLMYKKALLVDGESKNAKIGQEHESYHVYGQKIIDGITYEIKSDEAGYSKETIELMTKSIRSIKEIEN